MTQSCPNFVQKFGLLSESVIKFKKNETQSALKCAWQNKMASCILNFKQCKCVILPAKLLICSVSLQVRLHGVTVIHSPGASFSMQRFLTT